MERKEHFERIAKELAELFSQKNLEYGDDFFTGGYSDIERWMSIKRKVARLTTFYEKKTEMKLETATETWQDLAIYCIMELMYREINNGKQSI